MVVTFDDGYVDNLTQAAPCWRSTASRRRSLSSAATSGAVTPSGGTGSTTRCSRPLTLPDRIDLQLDGHEIHWRPGAGDEERRAAHAEAWKVLRTLPPARRDEAVARIADACGLSSDDGCRPLSRERAPGARSSPERRDRRAHRLAPGAGRARARRNNDVRSSAGNATSRAMLGHPVQLFSYPHGQAR